MSPHLALYPFLLSGTVAVCLVSGWVAWRHRDRDGAGPLAVFLFATAWWSLASLVGYVVTDPGAKLAAHGLVYVGSGVVPVAWLAFAVEYTEGRSLTRRAVGGLLVVPAAVVVLVWTNGAHGLVWQSVAFVRWNGRVVMQTTHGVGFWAFVAYSSLLVGAGTGLVVRTALLSDDAYRGQSLDLTAAALVPWPVAALDLGGVFAVLNPTSTGFAMSGVVLLGSMFRRQLLQLVPGAREVARDEVVDSMAEAVIVIDGADRVADLNPAAADLAGRPRARAVGSPLSEVFPAVAAGVDLDVASAERHETTVDSSGRERRYEVQVVPLNRGYGAITGRLLTLRDVTERHRREQRVQRQRRRLEVLNRVLRHDIRNGMNVIMGQADRASAGGGDVDAALQSIRDRSREIVALSEKARRFESVLDGAGERRGAVDVVALVERVATAVRDDYPAARVRTDTPDRALVAGNGATEHALRHVLENGIEHNDRAHPVVEVSVEKREEMVVVRVADDGPGLPSQERAVLERDRETQLDHSSGLGLWLVTWAAEDAGGDVRITANEPRGTVVSLRLPRADSTAAPDVAQSAAETDD